MAQAKKRIALILILALAALNLPSNATADTTFGGYFAISPDNTKMPGDLYQLLNGQHMSVSVQPSDLATITFAAYFDSALSPNSFMSVNGLNPLLRLRVYTGSTVGTPYGNINMEPPATIYTVGVKQKAKAYSVKDVTQGTTSVFTDLSNCSPQTWLDSASRNAVFFSILRSCSAMPDIFFASMYIESDIYNSTILNDHKSFPETPSFFDLRSVPKPPKTDQAITLNQPNDVSLEVRQISVQATNSSSLPIAISSNTPTTCAPIGTSTTISLLAPGTCTLSFFAAGNTTYADSKTYTTSFTIIAPKVNQTIQYNFPELTMDSPSVTFSASTSYGLPVQVSLSQDYGTCRVNSSTSLTLLRSGTCSLLLYSPGDATRNPVQQVVTLDVKAAKIPQNIYGNLPSGVTVDMGTVTLDVSTDSGLDLTIQSLTPKVCFVDPFSPYDIQLIAAGTCTLSFSAPGNDVYLPFGPGSASFVISPKPKATPTPTPKKTTSSGGKTPTPTPTPTPKPSILIKGQTTTVIKSSAPTAAPCNNIAGSCKTTKKPTPTPTPTKKR